ncbi:uncharacterized protein EI90DRAFT_1343138 [Cantharellus anzutake]|uniref:uncharacterized protein n=1 Tax=Cantharellus anzutake TaxID=1750568 RepID=UPI001902ED95|nr:uncharacterized protein EI90DRAFT_1343138 [Cantharellus anzutake]KAF8329769.1 hypothetical protein EI90DRAFT_1343138 [Cantharellus anzutake]
MVKELRRGSKHRTHAKGSVRASRSWNILPSDIIHEIVHYLVPCHLYPGDDGYSPSPKFVTSYIQKRAALASLALVSCNWVDPVMRGLYREIAIFICTEASVYSLPESLKSHGNLVRTIILDSRTRHLKDRPSLIDHFPDQLARFNQRVILINEIIASCSHLTGMESFGWYDDAFAELAQFNDNFETVVAPSSSMKHFTWTSGCYSHGLRCALQHLSRTLETLIIYEWDPVTPMSTFGRPFTPISRLPSLPRLSEIRLKKTSGPELLHMLELLKSTECVGEDENVTSRLRVLEVQRPDWLTPKDFLYQFPITKTWEWHDYSELPCALFQSSPHLEELSLLSPIPLSSFSKPPETLRILRTLIWRSYFGPHEFMRFLNSPSSRNLKLIELQHVSRTAMAKWKVEMETVLQVGRRLGKDIIIPTEIYPEPQFRQPGAIITRITRQPTVTIKWEKVLGLTLGPPFECHDDRTRNHPLDLTLRLSRQLALPFVETQSVPVSPRSHLLIPPVPHFI